MTVFNDLGDLLRQEEGLVLTPTPDAKKTFTIGYGHQLTPKQLETIKTAQSLNPNSFTKEAAETLLRQDMIKAFADARSVVGTRLFNKLSGARQKVLTSMAFQMGKGGLTSFKETLKFIKKGDFDNAGREMLDSKWARKQTPARAKRLSKMLTEG